MVWQPFGLLLHSETVLTYRRSKSRSGQGDEGRAEQTPCFNKLKTHCVESLPLVSLQTQPNDFATNLAPPLLPPGVGPQWPMTGWCLRWLVVKFLSLGNNVVMLCIALTLPPMKPSRTYLASKSVLGAIWPFPQAFQQLGDKVVHRLLLKIRARARPTGPLPGEEGRAASSK